MTRNTQHATHDMTCHMKCKFYSSFSSSYILDLLLFVLSSLHIERFSVLLYAGWFFLTKLTWLNLLKYIYGVIYDVKNMIYATSEKILFTSNSLYSSGLYRVWFLVSIISNIFKYKPLFKVEMKIKVFWNPIVTQIQVFQFGCCTLTIYVSVYWPYLKWSLFFHTFVSYKRYAPVAEARCVEWIMNCAEVS